MRRTRKSKTAFTLHADISKHHYDKTTFSTIYDRCFVMGGYYFTVLNLKLEQWYENNSIFYSSIFSIRNFRVSFFLYVCPVYNIV